MAQHYIITLAQSLDVRESKIVEDYLKSTSVLSGNLEESKQLKAYRYLREKKEVTTEGLIAAVGSKNIQSLLYHLTEKVYDALLLNKHIQTDDLFNEREQMVFLLKKKLLLAKILYRSLNQGKTETISNLLSDTVKTAKDYQIFDVLVEALSIQKYFRGIRGDQNTFKEFNSQIDFYNNSLKAVYAANDYYLTLAMEDTFVRNLTPKALQEKLSDSIAKMQSDYKKYKAAEIHYYSLLCQMALFEKKSDFHSSLKVCINLIKLLKTSKVSFSNNRLGIALNNQAHYLIYIGKYREASRSAEHAKGYFIKNSLNYLNAIEQQFYAQLFDGDIAGAKDATDEMLEHSLIDAGLFRNSKFEYYRACLYFLERKFRDALKSLTSSLEIERDKGGWNLAVRILHILTFIEMGKFDEAGRSLESLRKYSSRLPVGQISQRDEAIIRILRDAERQNFALGQLTDHSKKLLKEISNDKGPKAWQPFTPEIIRIDRWMTSKISN